MIIVLLNMYMYVRRLTSYVTIEICTGFFFLWGGGLVPYVALGRGQGRSRLVL